MVIKTILLGILCVDEVNKRKTETETTAKKADKQSSKQAT